jgi:hypothetical protein
MGRRVAWSGFAYVTLLMVAGTIGPADGMPGPSATTQEIGASIRAHAPTTLEWAGVYLEVIALLALVVFVVGLWRMLAEADRDGWLPGIALSGGLLSAALKIGSLPAACAALYRAHEISPGVATALIDANSAAFVLTWATFALMLGAAGIVVLRTGALAAWLGWFAVGTALALMASIPVASSDPPTFMLALVWIIAAGVVLVRSGDHVAATAAYQRGVSRDRRLILRK